MLVPRRRLDQAIWFVLELLQDTMEPHAETLALAVSAKGPFLDQTGTRAQPGNCAWGERRLTGSPWRPQRQQFTPLPLYKYYGYSIHMCRPSQGKTGENRM